MTDDNPSQRGQVSDERDVALISGERPIDAATEYLPLHLSKRVFFWEEVLAIVFLGYAGLALLKVVKVMQHSHVSMAIGPAIFGITGLLGTFTLFKLSRRKRMLRETERAGQYRLGIFLLDDRLLINIPRILRSIPYDLIESVYVDETFQGQAEDALCIEYTRNQEPHRIRMRESYSIPHAELQIRIQSYLAKQD